MNKLLLTLLLLFSFLIGSSQTELDSLIAQFEIEQVDSLKLEIARTIVRKTKRTDLKTYRTFVVKGINLSKVLKKTDEAITFSGFEE